MKIRNLRTRTAVIRTLLDIAPSPRVSCRLLRKTREEEITMPFVDTSELKVIERLPGWKGRYFHSSSMTFAHYDFQNGFVDSRALPP